MASASQRVFDESVRHAINLQRFNKSTINGMLRILKKSDAALAARIAASDGATAAARGAMLTQIREAEVKTRALLQARITKDVGDLAAFEIGAQRRIIPAAAEFATVSLDQVRSAAILKPFKSVHLQWAGLQAHVDELSRRRRGLIVDRIKQGFVQGESTQSITRGLIGTRRLGFKDGLLERPRREVEAVVRTSLNHASTTAREAYYERNEDRISGVRWTAVLDSRTSPICQALDGQIFPVGEGPRPPAHPNCRSITIAILKGEEPPEFTSYQDWIKRQSAETQDDVLGKTKAKLFRKGGLTVDRFVDRRNNPLTIAQLRKVEAAAFDKAGL